MNRHERFSIWFCCVIGLLLPVAAIDCSSDPKPSVTSEGGKVAVEFVERYRSELASVFREAGDLVKAEKLISDEELLEHLQEKTETARKRAAEPIGVLLEKRLPNGEIYSRDSEVLYEIASGLEDSK